MEYFRRALYSRAAPGMEGTEESGDMGQSLEWDGPDGSSLPTSAHELSYDPIQHGDPYESTRYPEIPFLLFELLYEFMFIPYLLSAFPLIVHF